MKFFTIKPEYLTAWGEDCDEDTVITEDELSRLSEERGKPTDELLEQLNEADFHAVYDFITEKCHTKNGSGHWCWSWQMLTDDDIRYLITECPSWDWVDQAVWQIAKDRGIIPDDCPYVVNEGGYVLDFDAAVGYMDDEILETLRDELAPCSKQKFFTAYEAAHLAKYGEEWELSKANPTW